MRVVICLLNKRQLLSLTLVETTLDTVRLLELLKSENEELCVVLVRKWWEGNGCKLAGLEPVDGRGVDGDGLLGRDVGTILEVSVLSLLLSLEVETSETTEVLLDDADGFEKAKLSASSKRRLHRWGDTDALSTEAPRRIRSRL